MRLILIASAAVLLAGAAHAADLSAPVPMAPAPVTEAPAYNWTGAYVGLEGGYAWGVSNQAYDFAPFTAAAIAPLHLDGLFGGVEAGANYQLSNAFVLGFEADASYGDISDTVPDVAGGPPNTISSKTDWSGTVRGRLGYAFGRTLVYGTGGLALAHSTASATDGPLSESATLLGWTAGAGIEQAITDRVSVKAEYLYSAFGDHNWFEGEAYQSTSNASSSAVRVGVNLHF